MSDWMIYAVGFTSQLIFASRIIIQWFKSEKSKKLETPTIFWKLSLIAAILFFIYGYLRKDFSIMLGQVIIYYVFIRNLQLQDQIRFHNQSHQQYHLTNLHPFLQQKPKHINLFYHHKKN